MAFDGARKMPFFGWRLHVVLVEGSVAKRLAIGDILALNNVRCTVFEKPLPAIEFLDSICSQCGGKCCKYFPSPSLDIMREEANPLIESTGLASRKLRQQNATSEEVVSNREKRPTGKAFVGRSSSRRKAGSGRTASTRGVFGCRQSAATTSLNVYRRGMPGQGSFAAMCRPRSSYLQHDLKRPPSPIEGSYIAISLSRGLGGPSQQRSSLLPVISEVQGFGDKLFLRGSADIVHFVLCDISFSDEGVRLLIVDCRTGFRFAQ